MSAKIVIDYITGRELRATPEEQIRQLFEHILVDDLGYPKANIGIEVTIQRGSNRDAEKADIVVFHTARHTQDNMLMVVEIEAPRKQYDQQALSYATATTAPYCVWFAGFEKDSKGPYYLYRDLAATPTTFVEIPALPRFGESYDTIGHYRKEDLKPARSLKLLFERIHFRLYGSGPIKREENVAKEVIKLLFSKIEDELSPSDLCEFRATPRELASDAGRDAVKARIDKLYKSLQGDPVYSDMFEDEFLEYDAYWVSYIVSELQGIALLHPDTNTDALGDAYEVFLPSTLKGESGQFFTPRPVVRLAMDMLAPSYAAKEKILDPACGSGGFLSIAIEHLKRQMNAAYLSRGMSNDRISALLKDYASNYVFGVDIEHLLYRIAKSYMAIIGDGQSNIFTFDSLEPPDRFPAAFRAKLQLGTVDVIATNPPFGTKIDDTRPYVLETYDLGHRLVNGVPTRDLLPGQDPDKLFLERAIQFLKEPTPTTAGGRMAIVLPKQNLSGAEYGSVQLRKWLLNNATLDAVIDLPREAFQPHTGTKTCLVLLRKQQSTGNYDVFMAVSESIGHNRRGDPVFIKDDNGQYVLDTNGEPVIWNDLPTIFARWKAFKADSFTPLDRPSCFITSSDRILHDKFHRMDAWYWDPYKNDLAKQIEDLSGSTVTDVVPLGELAIDNGIFYPGRHIRNYVPESSDSVPFLSGTQILQSRPFDVKYQPRDYAPARNHVVEKDWILVTRSGSTGRVVMVGEDMSGTMVTEHVIRVICDPEIVDPYYVYAYLASEDIGKLLLQKGIYASVVDHLTPSFIASIPVPRLTPEAERSIADQVRKSEALRAEANIMLRNGMRETSQHVFSAIAPQGISTTAEAGRKPNDT